MTHRPNMPTWDSFGQVQRVIRDRYREEERSGSLPTFKEFIKYLVGALSVSCPDWFSLGGRIVTRHCEDEENDANDKRALEARLAELWSLQREVS